MPVYAGYTEDSPLTGQVESKTHNLTEKAKGDLFQFLVFGL